MATRSDLFCTLLAAVIGVLASPAGAQEPARPATTPAQPSQIEKLLQAYPHAIAIFKEDAGAKCHWNGEVYVSDEPLWQLDDFLKKFLE